MGKGSLDKLDKEALLEKGTIRFREVLRKADLIELKFGAESYPWLSGICRKFSEEGEISFEQAAAIVAVLSPMVDWKQCLIAAKRLILSKGGVMNGPGLRSNYEKAKKILLENDLSQVSGPKIIPFYKTLLDHTCPDVVVDTHMLSAFHDVRSYTVDPRRFLAHIKIVVTGVQTLAEEKGWLPSRTQATIWIAWKRITRGFGDQLSLWQENGKGIEVPNLWRGILL